MKYMETLETAVDSVVESIGIDAEESDNRKAYLNISGADVELLTSLHDPLQNVHAHLMNAFYKHLLDFPETRKFLRDDETVSALKKKQWGYLSALTDGKYDWEYVRDRLRVGIVHQQIGLDPKWYLGAYSNYLCTAFDQIHLILGDNPGQMANAFKALLKIVFLDIGLVMDTYFCADMCEMRSLKALSENIICNVPAGLVVLDKDLCVLSTNRFVEQFTNIHHDELKGRNIEAVLPDIGLHSRLVEVMSRGNSQRGIVYERTDDKNVRESFEISIIYMRQSDEKISVEHSAAVMVVIEDLSEQERLRLSTMEADTRVRAIMDNVAEGIITIDEKGIIESFNAAAEHLFGYSCNEVLGENVKILMPDPYYSNHDGYLQRFLESNVKNCLGIGFREVEGKRKDGDVFAMELSISEVKLPERRIFVGMVKDISKRKESEANMRKLSSALAQTADSVIITDSSGVIEYVNTGFQETTGFTREEAMGKSPNILKSGLQDTDFYKQLWKTIRAGKVYREVIVNRRKGGEIYYEEKTITPIRDEHDNICNFVSSGKDITDRMRTQERLQYLAHHDVLTKLPNRLLFLDRLSQSMAHTSRSGNLLALMFLDLDRFKVINDTLGHQIGDELLKELAERLQSAIRSEDTVARLSGDEFAVLLMDMHSLDDIAHIANNLLNEVNQPFQMQGRELFLTTSIGIAIYPDNSDDADTMLKHADVAMYKAKSSGRNQYCFYSSEMNEQAHESLSLENDLRRALERAEFCLYYQPQISNADGKVMGVEALLRWVHPQKGLLMPGAFISLLEDTGMIVAVGDWVLHHACKQLRIWHDNGVDIPLISVNIAPRQLLDPGLTKRVQKILQNNRLDPDALELEITESSLMENESMAVKTLQSLHDIGVSIAMDDFGTGYSSLRYLREFPLQTLKIDRSFVCNLPDNEDDCNLATAIIAMGHGMRLKIIAEGVENEKQYQFLKKLSCDITQGYYFSMPVPQEQIAEYLN